MSKELVNELVHGLGVSKTNAVAFVQSLSSKYLIELVPKEDLQEAVEPAGRPLTQEEIDVLDSEVASDLVDDEDPNTDENNAAFELNKEFSSNDFQAEGNSY